jgi:hypothetical protein
MKTYIIDIETAPLPEKDIAVFQPEFKADTRLRDPVKIAEDIKNKKEKFISNAALNPLTASICAIGIWDTDEEKPGIYYGITEEQIINKFLNLIKEENLSRTKIVTFNGMNFDIPFICRRALLYGHDIFPTFYRIDGGFKILDKAPVFIDLAAIWDCRRKDYISLNELAIYMKVGSKQNNGELFYQMLEKNKSQAEEYLINDLRLTRTIAQKWGLIK